ncbi:hypothetical protein Cni_G20439 [Canna indica]|uniref:RING-type domain-containing protein n=1 Tax=Canna indica TaxID=4628 RepID=A0AAQ3KP41_9LILI|nr:hypothetical protein Cni_G20439 [Canna indica]
MFVREFHDGSALIGDRWMLRLVALFRGYAPFHAASLVSSIIAGSMSNNRQMEVHYINTGFPYTVTESFMDLFEGLTYPQSVANLPEAFQDQGNTYWSTIHTSLYKYGFSSPASSSYYSFSHAYEVNGFTSQLDASRCTWDDPAHLDIFDLPQHALNGNGDTETRTPSVEECTQVHHNANDSQVYWQDNIDPDSMTYEELLDLGETVGTQSRGLSQERISSLPVSKYKYSFFSRKKSQEERCVICQMNYKKGDRQMTLPCKHAYHDGCVTRWLSINKACPVCFVDVPAEEPKRE